MAQPQMARITCSQCNAWYSTERELRDHMQTAHRQAGSEHTPPPSSVTADRMTQGERNAGIDESRERTPEESRAKPD
jgi:uncharacterized membrane protein